MSNVSDVLKRIFPLGDRILLQVEELSDTKVWKIFLSDNRAERTRVGVILAVGPEVKNKALEVGAKVLISAYSGINVYMPSFEELDERAKFLREDEILSMFY